MPCDLLLLLRLCMSLYKQGCKAFVNGCIHAGQAPQSVFGFLNGPLQFVVGALDKRVAENVRLTVIVVNEWVYTLKVYRVISSCIFY